MFPSGQTKSLGMASIDTLGRTILRLNDLSLPDGEIFERLVEDIGRLIPNSTVWLACSDIRERAITSYLGPWAGQAAALAPAFGRHIESHPQFMALCHGTAAPVDAVSDYISLNQWRATGMYDEVLRVAGALDQLSSSLPLNEDLSFSIVVNRDRWGFTAQERALLGLIMPHVVLAWRNRMLVKRTSPIPAPPDEASAGFHCKIICDSSGNIIQATESVLRWLSSAFGAKRSHKLPENILHWLRFTLKESPITIPPILNIRTRRGFQLDVSLSAGSPYDLHTISFQRTAGKAEARAIKLTTLGLSLRQAEVLQWVADGKTNEEVGIILNISRFTVKAHLRAIFEILMVENRNAASAIAWKILSE
ncbi:helix-turn-helix transcriptional regulator [Luteolibacter sp. SL250]|uniref:helix-turn-helix transcriptional regulator n=1 Tax=Luteolibacter sp. SL250 TaxID=2995170 RepID=UPI00226EB2EC|nr:helix-turn-helix transcriptional regulator [Luteolibacter sp. SL250]WAC20761.1 helix-turn-helix transcriptional regulator [Luteolibacter sp. SL250]